MISCQVRCSSISSKSSVGSSVRWDDDADMMVVPSYAELPMIERSSKPESPKKEFSSSSSPNILTFGNALS